MTKKSFQKEMIVSDASPFISLEYIPNGHTYLHELFEKVLVPEKVMEELTRKHKRSFEEYLGIHKLETLIEIRKVTVELTAKDIMRLYDAKKDVDFEGEAYAISLALQENMRILLDDTTAIPIAGKNGLKVYNLGSYTIKAFRKGLITEKRAKHMLSEFRSVNIYDDKTLADLLTKMKTH